MKASTGLTYFAVFFAGMVLIKDGTAQTLIGNIATTAKTFIGGIKPITTVG